MKTILIPLFLIFPLLSNAQSRTITARILDSQTKKPIANAVVAWVDSAVTTNSNYLGYFQLTVSNRKELVISHEQYATSKVQIPEQDNFTILLERQYTDLGYFVLNEEPNDFFSFMHEGVKGMDTTMIYRGDFKLLFKDMNERIVSSPEYVKKDTLFKVDVLFTVTPQGKIDEVSVIGESLSNSGKEHIKHSLESLESWRSIRNATIPRFFIFKVTNEEVRFVVVEESARPANGMGGFYQYVYKSLRYPKEARRVRVEGKVFVQFVVERSGELSEVEVIKGIGYGCDEEAIRIVQGSPPWIPGYQRGKPVRQRYVVPINFRL